jgi:hypothetical protein
VRVYCRFLEGYGRRIAFEGRKGITKRLGRLSGMEIGVTVSVL